jgi:prephenate dehydratase
MAILPIENSTFGAVVETLDLLCSRQAGTDVSVKGTLVIPIKHSLISRKGTSAHDIARIYSHEQVRPAMPNKLG